MLLPCLLELASQPFRVIVAQHGIFVLQTTTLGPIETHSVSHWRILSLTTSNVLTCTPERYQAYQPRLAMLEPLITAKGTL